MTSPAITKSPENQKNEKKSPSHSVAAAEQQAAARAESPAASTSAAPQAEPFSWLRIFKLADLMMKQGC